MKANITIVRESLNTDRARAFGLVLKLGYVFDDKDCPRVEIFPDNEITKAAEWEIYGASDDRPDLVRIIEFNPKQSSVIFELEGKFKIDFTGRSDKEVVYARTGPKMEKAYHFEIEAVNPN